MFGSSLLRDRPFPQFLRAQVYGEGGTPVALPTLHAMGWGSGAKWPIFRPRTPGTNAPQKRGT